MTDTAGPTHHPEYYFEDGSIIFLVEDVSFNIHQSKLVQHSEFFKDMFLSKETGGGGEGQSDEHPIKIPDTLAVDFANLLWWLYTPQIISPDHQITLAVAYSILVLSHKYQFPLAFDFAAAALNGPRLNLPAVQRFDLARCRIVPQWLLPSIYGLLQTPFASLTSADARVLGPETLRVVGTAQGKIEGICKGLTSFKPELPHPHNLCFNKAACMHGLHICWARLGVIIHRPEHPVTLSEALQRIEAGGMPGLDCMSLACFRSLVDTIRPAFEGEAEMYNFYATAITKLKVF
ncbi:hypothetical protein BOTBODRAFT_48291 [Botryobasidium botryosum FD-172 SS1]|uniref:BTB domain-containing protein n=1 Tax=Botryobasidium botryosum (strain FD-172 SS1) TaxID=930990 RepID=A0A067LYA4_BOTB1|nr:hypothetical protein BOTBODRAFT_48291 [Botryobasidium botryosum FD-172 SS1]